MAINTDANITIRLLNHPHIPTTSSEWQAYRRTLQAVRFPGGHRILLPRRLSKELLQFPEEKRPLVLERQLQHDYYGLSRVAGILSTMEVHDA